MNHVRSSLGIVLVTAISMVALFIHAQAAAPEAPEIGMISEEPVREQARNFVIPRLAAQAVYLFDPTTDKLLYAERSNVPLPLASLTKIMTAVIATESHEPSLILPMYDGDRSQSWTLQQVLKRMLVTSSNSAAEVVAALPLQTKNSVLENQQAFIQAMNEKARVLGLSQTQFKNSTGLDLTSNLAGASGTAEDVAALLWYGYREHPELFSDTQLRSITLHAVSGAPFELHNTNSIVEKLPTVLASKTGLTDLAGGNLAAVVDVGINHPVVAVILGSTASGRFHDMEKLIRSTLSFFASDLYTARLSAQ